MDPPDAFRPDGARARHLARHLRRRLAGSFRYLFGACRAHVQLDEVAVECTIAKLECAVRVRPEVFIIHRRIVEAARDGELEALASAFRDFCAAPIAAPAATIVRNWADASFRPGELERFQWVFGEGGDTKLGFDPVPAEALAAACRALAGAMAGLDQADPELRAEIDALVHEVVFAQGDAGAGMTFDGVTAFFASGALLLNAAEHRTVPGALSGVVHEAAHLLLFAAAEGADLVENAPEERYPSPLRRDARPMNGVFHATIVSARIAYAMDKVLEAGVFGGPERAEAEGLRAGSRRAFEAGLEVVRAHGRPTPLGRGFLEGAIRAMAQEPALS
jgi:hypothetical protein